uniref:GrpE protein homolog n=1 Tax=Acrobeloides nanus TaxID=290746 RepID=A0A914DMN7_9BILA
MATKLSNNILRFALSNHFNFAGKSYAQLTVCSSRLNTFHSRVNLCSSSDEGSGGIKYTLRDSQGKRVSSEVFLLSVKKSTEAELGKELSAEEFVPSKSAINALAAEYDLLLEESDDFKAKYIRALAETENVRKRGIKQVEDAKLFSIQGFCKDLLEIADTLDLALENSKSTEDTSTAFKNLYEGVSMTKNVLLNTFKKHGLVPVLPEGQKFDPNLHEAIFEVPQEQTKYQPGHVAHVLKIGYSLHDRPVRAAQVGVVKMS